MITAININTKLWNRLIEKFISDQWKVTYKYEGFDSGIDFDLVILTKEREEIFFGWDNWFEGEIQCSVQQMILLEKLAKKKFQRGEPNCLRPEVIELYRSKK